MIDKDNLIRIKWCSGNTLYVELEKNDHRIYMTKRELLATIEVATKFVKEYSSDFSLTRVSIEDNDDEDYEF